MKKITLGLSALALAALGTGMAFAAQDHRSHGNADGNSSMSRAEAQAHATQMFTQMDTNKDGKLDSADRDARRAAMFDRIDADKNGQVSRTEFDAHHRTGMGGEAGEHRMGHRGMGGQGMGRHGMAGRHHGGGMMMQMADANKDNAVSQAEFTAAALQRFDGADANKDGQVTREERQTARAAMRAHRGNAAPTKPAGN